MRPPWQTPPRRLLAATIAVASVLALGVDPAAAQQETREEALERIRGEIAELQARLSKVQQEERTLEGELRGTRIELDLQERRVEEARTALEVARTQVAAHEERVAELEVEVERVRDELHQRLVAIYRLGRAGYVRLLFAADSEEGALPAFRQIRYLARRDSETLDSYIETKAHLELERKELGEERARVEVWVGQEEERQARLDDLRREQTRLLARMERQRQSLESQTEALEDKERKLSNFIAFLYGRAEQPVAGTPLQEFEGVLDWPCGGRVTVPFGPRRDERYGTRVPHNGIEIETLQGEEVMAVFPGKVLFAAHFKGYGPTVIMHHPGRVFTLYAGLGDLQVSYGDVLSLGQVVGGATDSLYFEIRIENHPEDPLKWLRD